MQEHLLTRTSSSLGSIVPRMSTSSAERPSGSREAAAVLISSTLFFIRRKAIAEIGRHQLEQTIRIQYCTYNMSSTTLPPFNLPSPLICQEFDETVHKISTNPTPLMCQPHYFVTANCLPKLWRIIEVSLYKGMGTMCIQNYG